MDVTNVHGLVAEDQAEHLRQALELAGVDDADIEIRPAPAGRYELLDETLHQDAAGARHGLVVGAVVGALIGLVVGLLLPQIEGVGQVAVTASAVAGFGALVGAMTGLQRADSLDADPVRHREVTEDDPMVLVAVLDEHWTYRAHRIMEQHDAVIVRESDPAEAP